MSLFPFDYVILMSSWYKHTQTKWQLFTSLLWINTFPQQKKGSQWDISLCLSWLCKSDFGQGVGMRREVCRMSPLWDFRTLSPEKSNRRSRLPLSEGVDILIQTPVLLNTEELAFGNHSISAPFSIQVVFQIGGMGCVLAFIDSSDPSWGIHRRISSFALIT